MSGKLRKQLMPWVQISEQYNEISDDEKLKDLSVKLGKSSIVLSFLSAILIGAFGAMLVYFVSQIKLSQNIAFGILGTVLCIAVVIFIVYRGMFASLLYSIYQLKLNKRAMGAISLIIWILFVAIIALGLFFLASVLS